MPSKNILIRLKKPGYKTTGYAVIADGKRIMVKGNLHWITKKRSLAIEQLKGKKFKRVDVKNEDELRQKYPVDFFEWFFG